MGTTTLALLNERLGGVLLFVDSGPEKCQLQDRRDEETSSRLGIGTSPRPCQLFPY